MEEIKLSVSDTNTFSNEESDSQESVSAENEVNNISSNEESDSQESVSADNEANNISSNEERDSQESALEDNETNIDKKSDVNAGWADAMSKILRSNKPKGKRSVVLAKAKKLNDVKRLKLEDDSADNGSKSKDKESIKKHEWDSRGRAMPNILDQNREKSLSKIATKGIVQLFNVVRQQQKTLDSNLKKAGGSIRKQEKAMKSLNKNAFFDTLMGDEAKSEVVDNPVKEESVMKDEFVKSEDEYEDEESKAEVWHVLREDFMTNSKLKDWNKEDNVNNISKNKLK